jgi:ferredoxin
VLGDDDRAHLLVVDGQVAAIDEKAVEDAIAMCPEAAISWQLPGPDGGHTQAE